MLCRIFLVVMLSVVMLSVIMLSVIMLSVIVLSFIMLSVIMLSVIMLSVIVLSVIMLSVIMLSVIIWVSGRRIKELFFDERSSFLCDCINNDETSFFLNETQDEVTLDEDFEAGCQFYKTFFTSPVPQCQQ